MIFEALELLRVELDHYVKALPRDDQVAVVTLGNVSNGKENELLLSLVNIEEEVSLKNTSPYLRTASGDYDVANPPIFLNLYVLVAAYSATNGPSYATALRRLAWAVQCFQRKRVFTVATMPTATAFSADTSSLRISLDLYPLSFEKASQLWSTLGDKQVPGVLYKMRLVEERGEGQVATVPPVLTIQQQPTLSLVA